MCSRPSVNQEGQTFACRECNECIAARKNDWVARCCAEMQTSKHTLAITLSYRNNDDGTEPLGVREFRYRDIQRFLAYLRDQYHRKYETRGDISYVVAGERGSQKGRCHWHMVLFSDHPISEIGNWSSKKGPCEMVLDQTLEWSIWKHGFVYVQRPDQGGVAYVLKYALKDQYNVVKSRGTMREHKAENHGAGMFRMSKKPPIGMRWLQKRCDEWEALGVVPVKLDLKIPGYKGFWYPKGKMREYLLKRLWEINEKMKQETGRDCPQWDALLATVFDVNLDSEGEWNTEDWEILVTGKTKREREEDQEYDFAERLVYPEPYIEPDPEEWQGHLSSQENPFKQGSDYWHGWEKRMCQIEILGKIDGISVALLETGTEYFYAQKGDAQWQEIDERTAQLVKVRMDQRRRETTRERIIRQAYRIRKQSEMRGVVSLPDQNRERKAS